MPEELQLAISVSSLKSHLKTYFLKENRISGFYFYGYFGFFFKLTSLPTLHLILDDALNFCTATFEFTHCCYILSLRFIYGFNKPLF